ncbi:MAG: hypothetical protein M1827_001775 [Pycnora praestabilis]|nr:MAG: hypothetical protein M1827_001775 [Pycnora praestabilis]
MISLSCGTNYIYSAWAPQFAEKLRLSSTQSNLIGVAANLGMYASGIPVGLMVDAKGPRYGVIIAYDGGAGSMSVPLICFFSLLTGVGSCSAFSAAIKTSALNWPHHRGTATAFPLAAFGLSAFFFSSISSLAFPGNTSNFLFLLAIGTFSIIFVSFFFLRIVPHSAYSAVPTREGRSGSSQLHRTKSEESRHGESQHLHEPGRAIFVISPSSSNSSGEETAAKNSTTVCVTSVVPNADTDETSSLMSKSSSSVLSSNPGDVPFNTESAKVDEVHSHHLDIRGRALLPKPEFWQLFALLGLLTGVGLMTINNIGNDAQALWSHYDDSVKPGFIQNRQLMHVSILSVVSATGRLASGVGSDLLVKKLGMSRFWCLVASSAIFCAAQLCAIKIENPHYLWAVSGMTGLGYGVLFGVYPSLVSDAFGVHGLSQNWGCMTLAPVVAGNIFNLLYGTIYDRHSTILPGGERDCPEGLHCYQSAYWITFVASLFGVVISLWSVRHEHVEKSKRAKVEGREAFREA